MSVRIDPVILLAASAALDKAIKEQGGEQALKDEVQPDQTIKDMIIDLSIEAGEIAIGHDTDKAPTTSIPLLAVVALLVKRMGLQRDAALGIVREVMTEAITLGKDASKTLLAETGVADAEKMLKDEVIGKLPRTLVRKSVGVEGVAVTVKSAGTKQAA